MLALISIALSLSVASASTNKPYPSTKVYFPENVSPIDFCDKWSHACSAVSKKANHTSVVQDCVTAYKHFDYDLAYCKAGKADLTSAAAAYLHASLVPLNTTDASITFFVPPHARQDFCHHAQNICHRDCKQLKETQKVAFACHKPVLGISDEKCVCHGALNTVTVLSRQVGIAAGGKIHLTPSTSASASSSSSMSPLTMTAAPHSKGLEFRVPKSKAARFCKVFDRQCLLNCWNDYSDDLSMVPIVSCSKPSAKLVSTVYCFCKSKDFASEDITKRVGKRSGGTFIGAASSSSAASSTTTTSFSSSASSTSKTSSESVAKPSGSGKAKPWKQFYVSSRDSKDFCHRFNTACAHVCTSLNKMDKTAHANKECRGPKDFRVQAFCDCVGSKGIVDVSDRISLSGGGAAAIPVKKGRETLF